MAYVPTVWLITIGCIASVAVASALAWAIRRRLNRLDEITIAKAMLCGAEITLLPNGSHRDLGWSGGWTAVLPNGGRIIGKHKVTVATAYLKQVQGNV